MKLSTKLRRLGQYVREGKYETTARILYQRALREWYSRRPHEGIDVVDEDWDLLVVLTACRYDAFREVNEIPGRLDCVEAKGTSLMEWLTENFTEYHDDVVYVSGNPRITDIEYEAHAGTFRGTDHFHAVRNVGHEAWDRERNTVPAEAVTDAAVEMRAEHPDKRVIVHYLQPHAPWIGEPSIDGADLGLDYDSPFQWFQESDEYGPWGEFGLAVDRYGVGAVREAYRGNLEYILTEVQRLIDALDVDGKTVVTGDHGEAIGEKFLVEHPAGVYTSELVEVPWLVVDRET